LGSTSVVDQTSLYASVDSQDADRLVVVAINKTSNPLTAELSISHPVPLSNARPYQLTASSTTPASLPNLSISQNVATLTMPGMSITTLVLTP
jgi:hypothetical protein